MLHRVGTPRRASVYAARMADEFERLYLPGDSVLHREKVVMRTAAVILASLAIGTAAVGAMGFWLAAMGDLSALTIGIPCALAAAMLTLASVAGTVVRLLVTDRELVVQSGILRVARIPLAAVTAVGLAPWDGEARRRFSTEGKDGIALIFGKRLVRVDWLGEGGRERVAYVGSENPDQLASIVERASAAAKRTASDPKTRVRAEDELEVDAAASERAATRES